MARLRHFVIQGSAERQSFVSTARASSKFKTIPPDDRAAHGTKLASQLRQAAAESRKPHEKAADGVIFVPIVVRSGPGLKLFLDSLDNTRIGSEIINFRYEDDGSERATVHVPRDKVKKFARKFEDYAHKDLPESPTPRNRSLAESIVEIRLAVLRDGDYWTDSGPAPGAEDIFWCEVWLRYEAEVLRSDGRVISVEQAFREEARSLGIRVSDREVRFREYVVVLAHTSLNRLSEFRGLLRHLAEFRRASLISPREFLDLTPAGQAEFVDFMLERTTFARDSAPAVCVLDGGVNRGHPLLEQALSDEHNLAWDDDWTAVDRNGHGTQMAGLALFGAELGNLLLTDDPIILGHRLEAVKILHDRGVNDPPDYGPITVGSVAKAEIESPNRRRVICMALTADDKERWLGTLWSAAIDQMCAGAMDETRRLMVVSAGNYESPLRREDYPEVNRNASIQDPAQAWNVVTVGAYTEKDMITDPDMAAYSPIAVGGSLSPRSTTSYGWEERNWPLKPDIVMEGGNYATSPDGRVWEVEDLSLLTTMISRDGALLTTMRDTSAAAALASHFGAVLHAEYPSLWPESVRGLLIHSARWTRSMHDEFPQKKERQDLLRCYGYGVPNLAVGQFCASHRATMIIQEVLQPFCLAESKTEARTNEMHVHSLPWPIELLRDLGSMELEMRVTLSYFIEPSPGRRGWNKKHRYQSHGLRFDLMRPEESMIQFRRRLTRDAWEDHATRPGSSVPDSRNWDLGADLRTKGSLHSDWWKGTAAELAASGYIAVHPVTGWWRERPNLACYDKLARYSLIVTLDSAREDVPIYQAIENIIDSRADITITN